MSALASTVQPLSGIITDVNQFILIDGMLDATMSEQSLLWNQRTITRDKFLNEMKEPVNKLGQYNKAIYRHDANGYSSYLCLYSTHRKFYIIFISNFF